MLKAKNVILIACVFAAFAMLLYRDRSPDYGDQQSIHCIPTVEMMTHLSELTTLRVDVADVQVTRLDGMTGSVEAAVLVKGDFTIETDLSVARIEQVNASARTAVVILPYPQPSPPRLDHARSRLVFVQETGLWKVLPGDEAYVAVTNAAFIDAQRLIGGAGGRTEQTDAARHQAEQVIHTFFTGLGWQIRVRWF